MFRNSISSEEEILLEQILEGKKLSRGETLLKLKESYQVSDDELKVYAKTLFRKIQDTSDYEYNLFINLILENNNQ